MTQRVYIVWSEDRTEGIVLTDKAKWEDMRDNRIVGDDLTESMAQHHGGERLFFEVVDLNSEGLN